ncbi:MAG: M48 family metallopeptidase [Phenylobacterium sp.]|uniref:M48 family metallopeptidase n=1 Tax=Phenylobacterium sp. TaxID=1871053 RepID=UPI00391AECB2
MSPFGRAPADGDRLSVAGAVVRLKVNARARRVSLRLDRTRREVVAVAPSKRRLPEAAAFARERADWIAARLAELPAPWLLAPGMALEVFGEACRLETTAGRARWTPASADQPARILAAGEGDVFAMGVVRVIKRRALEVFTARTLAHAAALGQPAPKVSVMDAKARWGSCKADPRGGPGAIRYSWRLALAPLPVAEYVVVHECAHLLEQNHGPQFWAHVRRLGGDERPHRQWLRAEGARLHAFGQSGG